MGKNRSVVKCKNCGGNMASFPHKNLRDGEYPVTYCQQCEEFYFILRSGVQLTMVEFNEWLAEMGGWIVQDVEQ